MASTVEISMDTSDWVAVNQTDVTHAVLQIKTTGPVLVQVADVKPAAPDIEGLMLMKYGLEELPLPGLVVGNKVWVRSFENEDNRVAAYLVS